LEIKNNEMVQEFLDDDASLMIDALEDNAKADLLLYFSYKTAQHMRILVGILTIWTCVGATALLALLFNFLLR
jgi:hypothetical protein